MRFETLIEQYHDEIYRYLWRMLGQAGRSDRDAEAQDLAQETFLRAYRAFERLRPDSNHRAWLYKIATNCAYSALRREQRRERHDVPLQDEAYRLPAGREGSPRQRLVLDQQWATVREAVAALPPKQQAAVVLRHLQGLSYGEVARALDCSQDSARANVYQGLQKLRRALKDERLSGD